MQNQRRFSKLSFLMAIVTSGLLVYCYSTMSGIYSSGADIQYPSQTLIYALQIFCLLGLTMMILSVIRKEPTSWYQWVGGILDVILFVLIIGATLAANIK